MKADAIADRIGLSAGLSHSEGFSPEKLQFSSRKAAWMSDLRNWYQELSRLRNDVWIGSLGSDLSVFATCTWSSLSSLQDCANEIGKSLKCQVNAVGDGMYEGLNSAWQEAWGGIFVSSLREVAGRCLEVALISKMVKWTKRNVTIS